MVDLHLHTTASDGLCTAEELIARARDVGLTVLAVTDHDTMAAVPLAAAAAAREGLQFIPGMEITSVCRARDAHVLGYFVDPAMPALVGLIADQRRRRVERAHEIATALARLGAPIDVDELIASAGLQSGKAIGRPTIARALVSAGHVATTEEAFERYLGDSCAAYVPHSGASPAEVTAVIVQSGGIASLAHPGLLKQDDEIPALIEMGLGAIEVYHSSHDAVTTAHYAALARRFDLAVTGGSDYHGEGTRRADFFGVTHLPLDEYERFLKRAGRKA